MVVASKQYLLVQMSRDYADEFDVHGFVVVSQEYFEEAKKRILAMNSRKGLHLNFGTNESLTWSSARELIEDLDVTELPFAEAQMFAKHFEPFSVSDDFIAAFGESDFLENVAEGEGY